MAAALLSTVRRDEVCFRYERGDFVHLSGDRTDSAGTYPVYVIDSRFARALPNGRYVPAYNIIALSKHLADASARLYSKTVFESDIGGVLEATFTPRPKAVGVIFCQTCLHEFMVLKLDDIVHGQTMLETLLITQRNCPTCKDAIAIFGLKYELRSIDPKEQTT